MSRKRRIFTFKNKRHMPRPLVGGIALAVRLLRLSYRVRVTDRAGMLDGRGPWPVVVGVWHNRLLLLPAFFPRRLRRGSAAIVSASRDGEYAAAFVRQFGLEVVRGSSSRGGYRAFRELKRKIAAGRSVVLTLDGPRGPRYEVQPGATLLAEVAGVPVVPLSVNAPSRWEFHGWDRTQVPKPLSRIDIVIGEPLDVPRCRDRAERDRQRERLRTALLEMTGD